MSKARIVYKDIAPGADEDARAAAIGGAAFSHLDKLPYGGEVRKNITLETGGFVLDNEHLFFETSGIAFWSADLSGADCRFVNAPVITISFTETHSSLGISFEFDEANSMWCSALRIAWYQGGTLLKEQEYSPDGTSYFCSGRVDAFDKVVITLLKTSLPFSRARISKVIFGIVREYGMTNLRSVKIDNQTNVAAVTLPASTMDFTLNSREPLGFMFQLKQELDAYSGDKLIGTYYITDHTRITDGEYKISSSDAIGGLDGSDITPMVVNDQSAQALLRSLVEPDFGITFDVPDQTITGVLEKQSRRAAIHKILFSCGWVCTTDASSTLDVFALDDVLKAFDRDHAYNNASVKTDAIVTAVSVTAHKYTQSASGDVDINGVKYRDDKTVYTVTRPGMTSRDKANKKEFSSCTVLDPEKGQTVAERLYNYYQLRQTDQIRVVWDGDKLGDLVELPTMDGTMHRAYIERMTINLSNTVAADLDAIGAVQFE